jgi:hypothetical protein
LTIREERQIVISLLADWIDRREKRMRRMGIVTILDHGSGISAGDMVAPPGELAGGRVLAPAENSELVAHVWPRPATVARRGLRQIAAPGGSASADLANFARTRKAASPRAELDRSRPVTQGIG